jgi:hypothetical protein
VIVLIAVPPPPPPAYDVPIPPPPPPPTTVTYTLETPAGTVKVPLDVKTWVVGIADGAELVHAVPLLVSTFPDAPTADRPVPPYRATSGTVRPMAGVEPPVDVIGAVPVTLVTAPPEPVELIVMPPDELVIVTLLPAVRVERLNPPPLPTRSSPLAGERPNFRPSQRAKQCRRSLCQPRAGNVPQRAGDFDCRRNAVLSQSA